MAGNILKDCFITNIGCFQNVTIANDQDVAIGQLDFQVDTHTLKEVKVVASAPKVVVKADTFQYNASAFRV